MMNKRTSRYSVFGAHSRPRNGFSVLFTKDTQYTPSTHTNCRGQTYHPNYVHTCFSLLYCCIQFDYTRRQAYIWLYLVVRIRCASKRACVYVWINAVCLDFLRFDVSRATLKCSIWIFLFLFSIWPFFSPVRA